ncbi:two-component sensor histidine kinase [Pyxidicoccus fallax]|uniref:histidine kinase n=1 Tax=Pyxidicoccus fallax TaxID=394095 RepID=A0A848LA59_9BACT|nr:ATP-binding protein [Pyxidicoccus fallax]NMO15142.1 two-component sensor histidine kinase [Pyxidicoccus fallax]NPC85209.1 two-component sensor histidine kinase [Pyxidicoccus fallax]
MSGPARWRPRGPWMPWAAAVLMCAVLLSAALFSRSTANEAYSLVARGMATVLTGAGIEAFRHSHGLPTQADLDAFLEAHQAGGLRYVAIMEDSRVLVSAGEGSIEGIPLDAGPQLYLEDGRARFVHRIRRSRPEPGPGETGAVVPTPAPPEAADRAQEQRRPLRIAYEFEPLTALELEARSERLLGVAIISCAGILVLAFAFTRSLAQREALSEELERGRRLAALGTMSAVLAHELRNPLASLKGHAQLLAERVERDEVLHPKANRVVGEAVRLEQLLNDLLAFVRSGELHRADADPNDVLRAAVESTGETSVEARYLPARTQWKLDPGRMQQALENVLRNAVQASPAGQRVEASVEQEGKSLVFTVKDHGPGIPAGEEERIFEPFVTGRLRGVGLGLAITRRIVELHGGTVSARSHAGGGAEFRLTVPMKGS